MNIEGAASRPTRRVALASLTWRWHDVLFGLWVALFACVHVTSIARATENAKLLAAFSNDEPALVMALEAMTVLPYGNPANFYLDSPTRCEPPAHWYDLRYNFFYYGGAYLDLGLLVFVPLQALGHPTFPTAPIILRLISLGSAMVALVVLYLFGRHNAGPLAGLLGVFVLLTDRNFHSYATTIHPDSLQLCLCYLALLAAVQHAQLGTYRSLCLLGILAGLVQGTKVGGPWLVPMALLATYWGCRLYCKIDLGLLGALSLRLTLLGFTALLAYFLSTPYAFLDGYYRSSLQSAWVVVSGQEFSHASIWTWLDVILGQQGWLFCVFAGLATILLLARMVGGRAPKALLLALTLAVSNVLWYAGLGGLWVVTGYLLVAFGLQGILVGDLIARASDWFERHSLPNRWVTGLVASLLALSLLDARWFALTCDVMDRAYWQQQTPLAVDEWARTHLAADARVLWDDVAYIDPSRCPKQHMVGGVIKYNYVMFHQPDYLILSSSLHDSDWYRELRKSQNCSLTDSYPFSMRLYQDLLGRQSGQQRLGPTGIVGIELAAVIEPSPLHGNSSSSGDNSAADWGALAPVRSWWLEQHRKWDHVMCMIGVAQSGEPVWRGSKLFIYRVHPEGGASGRPCCLSGGDEPGYEAVHAFYTYSLKGWKSQQRGTAAKGQACLGFDFGGGQQQSIARMFVRWSDPGHMPLAVQAQYSDDGQQWTTASRFTPSRIATSDFWIDEFVLPECGSHRYWRILADGEVPGHRPVWIRELKLIEKP